MQSDTNQRPSREPSLLDAVPNGPIATGEQSLHPGILGKHVGMELLSGTPAPPNHLPLTRLFVLVVSVVILLAGASYAILQYKPKPAEVKSLQLAGISLRQADKNTANRELSAAAQQQLIHLTIDGITYTYGAKDLGVRRDINALVDNAYAPVGSLADKIAGQHATSLILPTYVEKAKLMAAIKSKLGSNGTARDAALSVNGGTVSVMPAQPGLTIDYDQLAVQLAGTDLRKDLTLTVNLTKQQPAIPTSAANAAKLQADAQVALPFSITTDIGSTKSVTASQKAAWLVFTPDHASHTITVSLNAAAAQKTMTQLAQGFNQPVKDRTTLTLSDGSTRVIDEGRAGVAIDGSSLDTGLKQFQTALTGGQGYTLQLKAASVPPGIHNLGTATGGKFVLVDIANFSAYAINGNNVDRTMVVSTGRPSMPTPRGHFQILSKTRLITMRGCAAPVGCWVVPNVPNAEFFTPDGDALHGTYWHVDWGHQNLSHGCVNLQLDDAAWLYDWTDVGTDVIVI